MTYLEEIEYDIAQQEAKIRQDQEWLEVLKDRRERAISHFHIWEQEILRRGN